MKVRKPRPHIWRIQGEIPHQQYIAWQRMKAQAVFRKEQFDLTFDEFRELWTPYWEFRGRGSDDYCLTRWDYDLPWDKNNSVCMRRKDHLKRAVEIIKGSK